MTVNHLYSEMPDGSPAPDRVRVTEALRLVESEHGVPLYDTRSVIVEHGIEAALVDQNHYRTEFEPVVARHLLDTLLRVAAPA